MDEYDEFGNYLGGEVYIDEDDDEDVDHEEEEEELASSVFQNTSQIVLAEDKALFPSASSVFGGDVEIVHASSATATQPRSVPILPRSEVLTEKKHVAKTAASPLSQTEQFENLLSSTVSLLRTLVFVGALQCGKSSLVRLLHDHHTRVETQSFPSHRPPKIVNVRRDEQARSISLKLRPVSGTCQNYSKQKSFFLQTFDSPGHVNFFDEVECGLEIVDGVVLVIDCVEGIQLGTELVIQAMEKHGLLSQAIVCINKMDRLIHELKLPPEDASKKIHHLVESLEKLLHQRLDPKQLCFASAEHGWCVDLYSMAKLSNKDAKEADTSKLASLLFGEIFFDPIHRSFSSKWRHGMKRTFDYFCLEPIYKVYSHVLGGTAEQVSTGLGIPLSKRERGLDAQPLLELVLKRTFPYSPKQVLTELIAHKILPRATIPNIPLESEEEDVLLAHCVKHIHAVFDDGEPSSEEEVSKDVHFRVLVRVFNGALRVGDSVFLKEHGQEETQVTIKGLFLPTPLRRPISQATKGMCVLVSGIDFALSKSATLMRTQVRTLFPLLLRNNKVCQAVCKVAMEPYVSSDLPKMLSGLRAVQRSYPSSRVQVEESGEHVLFGTGELQLDCMLADLRRFAGNIEIKVCDPFVSLMESVSQQSTTRAMFEDKKSRFSIICSPVEPVVLGDLDSHTFDVSQLRSKYGYDILAARGLWTWEDTNLFVDDTLLENKKEVLLPFKDAIVQGFQWALREGPLCEEPLRGVKFKLLDCQLPPLTPAGRIIPVVRRLCHQALLKAGPLLCEPVFLFDALFTQASLQHLIKQVLAPRRGTVTRAMHALPGTRLFRMSGTVPALDAFGLETELRLKARGQVLCQMCFDHWSPVPGDVLDESLTLRPLEPSPTEVLARDLIVKTRRRKGLPESLEASTQVDTRVLQDMLLRSVKE